MKISKLLKKRPMLFSGLLLLYLILPIFFAVKPASAAVDKVICVPWQGNIAKYHTTWNGLNVTLKGVIKTTTTSTIWYRWNYGDGSPTTAVSSLSGKIRYTVETQHTYSGTEGTPFTAQLLVDDVDNSMTHAVSDNYLVKIETQNLDSKINVAIDNGLWYLYKSGGESSYYHSYDGSPVMVWSYSSYYASPTASAVQAFEINGHKETGDFDEDPYAEYVQLGLNWLFNGYYYSTSYPMLQSVGIGLQHGENPDSRPNGKGIECRDYGYRPIYQGGMVMDAIISSGTPDADSGRDFDGDGKTETYREIVQDMIDMYAWGQYDDISYGGWRYNWNDWPDNSACQWAAIGMIPAQESPWNCTVPSWVKTYDDGWLNYSHYQWNWDGTQNLWGGFGYTGPTWGDALTPSGMVQLSFVGATTDDPRWIRCERWFADNWKDVNRDWLDQNNVYAYYAFAKAMRLAKPNPVVIFSQGGIFNGLDWYRGSGATMGLAEKISSQLIASSYWDYYGANLGTAWCVIILKPVLFAEAPVACFDADPNPSYPDASISFDPSCSGHSESGKDISNLVLFEWDWDNDGVYDATTTSPNIITHTFSCSSVPCVYPVTLRVTDDSGPPRTANYVQDIQITNPPHPPVASLKGPYMVSLCEGDSLILDGSDSYDPDEGQHEAGCPDCPDDTIISYEWDLLGAPWDFDNEITVTGTLDLGSGFTEFMPESGAYDTGLRVTDNTENAYPGSEEPNLTNDDFAVVDVYNAGPCDITATALCQAVSLVWDDVGADYYVVYMSTTGPNLGFADVETTTATSKIMGSFVMNANTWFRVMAVTGQNKSLSKAVAIWGDPTLCNPTADAGGPYEVCLGDSVTLDGSASTALVGTIVAWDWDLDDDGDFDDAFGETVNWTPSIQGTYPIGLMVTSSDSLELTNAITTTVEVSKCLVDLALDICPIAFPNKVSFRKNWGLSVGVLGSRDFDVTTLNWPTVKFGKTGTEASPMRAPIFRDFNRDGNLDAIYMFIMNKCGFAMGNTQGILTGKLNDGTEASGSDSVKIIY
ncbi:MAG: hypothetical protein HZA77_04165 [Candidatus Schekmanbacteria bacterium]|nr:hypothetical protein [Candidatus Schekmanbacteria bacterium]